VVRRNVFAVGCVGACSLACGTRDADWTEPVAQASSPITHGSDDTGDPAVVAVLDPTGATSCSGTLIAPYIVLTAAHCTIPAIVQGGSVVFGASVTAPVATIRIATAVADPMFDAGTLANDIGLLVLASAASATPVPLGASAPTPSSPVHLVGWGVTGADAGDLGQKRQGTSTVGAVDATTFEVASAPSQPCDGDSGGPALITSGGTTSVEGVTSHGDSACVQGATYTRVDAFAASFLQPTMAMFAPGAAAAGARCFFPEQCAGGASDCLVAPDDPALTYCTQACQKSPDCPKGMSCVAVSGGSSQCQFPVPTPGAYGATCSSDTDCIEGNCTAAGSAAGICALRCDPVTPMCPPDFACTNTAGIDYFCIGQPPPPASKSGGGCALGPSPAGAAFSWLAGAALAAVAALRRRSRRFNVEAGLRVTSQVVTPHPWGQSRPAAGRRTVS
jgi:hypothetical protein